MKNLIMIQEVEEQTTLRSEASPRKSPPPVEKPGVTQRMTPADAGPLYSGYALTPGILFTLAGAPENEAVLPCEISIFVTVVTAWKTWKNQGI